MSENISGIMTIGAFLEKRETFMGYVDYCDMDEVQKWVLKEQRKYVIPKYQREIKWGSNKLQTLIDDVLKGSKFLGNIFMSTSDKTIYEIMDGQQRITAILMLLEALRLKDAQKKNIIIPCEFINETFPYFYMVLKNDFIFEDDEQQREYIKSDVLEQESAIKALWKCAKENVDRLEPSRCKDLEKNILDCEINLLISKVNIRKIESRKLCVDYFIDINNKNEHLDSSDILKAYAFREQFDYAANKWIEIQEHCRTLVEVYYPKESMFLHYLLCSVNPVLEYRLKNLSDDYRLTENVNFDGKVYSKGTDIEVLINVPDFYKKMFETILEFQKMCAIVISDKASPGEEFCKYLNIEKGKLDYETQKNIFTIINGILRSSDVVPKLLLLKYFIDVILNENSAKNDYKIIYDINVIATCFSAGNGNAKMRGTYAAIVMKKNWRDLLRKRAVKMLEKFSKSIKFGKEIHYLGKPTKTSGQYLADRVGAIAYAYEKKDEEYVLKPDRFFSFTSDVNLSGEHFLINQSMKLEFVYKENKYEVSYPARFKGRMSYLANYLIINKNLNHRLGNNLIREKIRIIDSYTEHEKMQVFVDRISLRNYQIVKQVFGKGKCPTKEEIDACGSVEEASELINNYYENFFEIEMKEYIALIGSCEEVLFSPVNNEDEKDDN